MRRTGVANLPLHGGKAPKWLFERMVKLSQAVTDVILYEHGCEEFIRRLSDPFWFQAFSCVLGFDYHSSGTTTVTCAALKEAVIPEKHGFALAGGKGKTSLRTLFEIERISDVFGFSTKKIEELQYSSRLSAKVDNCLIQDGFDLYHHVFILTETGVWGVIQQGINYENCYARRYHWFSKSVKDFVKDPHEGIVGDKLDTPVLDMSSSLSVSCQNTCVDLVCDNPVHLRSDWAKLGQTSGQTFLDNWDVSNCKKRKVPHLDMPRVVNWKKLREIYEFQPRNYEELISMKNVGPRTVRALALISDLIYGDEPSWRDPVKYSFAVGGKDGVPFPVDKKAMDEATDFISESVKMAKIDEKEKIKALKNLRDFVETNQVRT